MRLSFKHFLYVALPTITALPLVAIAQDNDPVTGPVNSGTFVDNTTHGAALLPLSTTTENIGRIVFVRGIRYALLIVGIMSISFIIYSAIQLSTAAGDEAKIEQAKKALIWSIVGTIVAMMTFFIINATQSATEGTF